MQYGWTAPVLPILLGPDSPVKTTKHQGELLESMLMIGSFCGLIPTVYFVEKLGRKRSILLSSFVTLVIWIITAVASEIEHLYVARFFAGAAGNMAFVAAPMYIAEIADQKIRGFLSSIIYLMMLIGILLIYGIAPFVPIYVHCIVGAALVAIELIIFPFMPESPYYLIHKNRKEEARKSLKRLRPDGSNISRELEEIAAVVTRQKTEKGRPQDLILVPSNRKAFMIMAFLNGAQHFSSISVMLMNLHLILEAAGSIYIKSSTAAIIFSFIMFISAVVASFLMDKFGRKILLITSSILTGTCLMVLSVYFSLKSSGYNLDSISWIPIVSTMCYACFFKLGLGIVPIVLTAELFPTKIKAIGMTLADTMYVVSCLLSLQVYQLLFNHYGIQYPFYIFSVSCFLAALFTYFFIPETKGKSLDEIQFLLKGQHCDNEMEKLNKCIKS